MIMMIMMNKMIMMMRATIKMMAMKMTMTFTITMTITIPVTLTTRIIFEQCRKQIFVMNLNNQWKTAHVVV